MLLQEKIKESMKDAMKRKDMSAVTTFRGLMSAFTHEVVASGKTPDSVLEDDLAMKVLIKEAKKRKDAISQFTNAGREELAQEEKKELQLIEEFLPSFMSREKILLFVKEKQKELDISNPVEKGKFMGLIMSELKGKADGSLVKEVVDNIFHIK